MNESPPERSGNPRLTLLLVIFAFVCPIGIAWWFVYFGNEQIGADMLNHGELLSPPLDIREASELAPLRDLGLGPGQWAMVYVTTGACDRSCTDELEKLNTIHTVLGHRGDRVQVAALLEQPLAQNPARISTIANPALSRHLLAMLPASAGSSSHIFFLDWRGQIPMRFDGSAKPGGITKDLKRLLRASKIN